jgi:hypothetical protein
MLRGIGVSQKRAASYILITQQVVNALLLARYHSERCAQPLDLGAQLVDIAS